MEDDSEEQTRDMSDDAWQRALATPSFVQALDEGLADLAAGRVKPWAEVRARQVQTIVPDLAEDMRRYRREAEARNAALGIWEMPEDTGEGSVIVTFGPDGKMLRVRNPFDS